MPYKHKGKRMVKSVFEGPEYIKGWKDKSSLLRTKLPLVEHKATPRTPRPLSNLTPQRIERMIDLIHDNARQSRMTTHITLNDILRRPTLTIVANNIKIAELIREREKNVYLRAENAVLRSRSPSANALILMQQKDEICTPRLDNKEVQDLLQAEHKDADLQRLIPQRKAHLLPKEVSRAEHLIDDRKFRAWFMSLQSEKLLVLWNHHQPRTHAGISPYRQFICLTWFCGLHSKHGNDDAGAMLADLIVQLCQRHHFDFGREHDDTDKSLVRGRDTGELYHLFYRLMRSLPKEITVIILADEISVYGRGGYQDGINIFNKLIQLVTDATIQSVIKLLFTSTKKVPFLNEEFKQSGLTLCVDTIMQKGGNPSERRMERQMREYFD
ncbi:hypothetical protein CFAM422_002471 [Trichoderma lentiforme]|uniref:Uncharacterized protein n=1 Tax=Trichoderma lentiforme TaxID=1567552 RepID=A0A9P4XP86_9HYPO|nr:hypothetical protein CFAM422_002471 [Trichoderma lentiforme]